MCAQAGARLLQAMPARRQVHAEQRHDVVETGTQHVVQQQHGARIGRQLVECGKEFEPDPLAGRQQGTAMGGNEVHARQTDQHLPL